MKSSKRGFTLTEIIVVVAIIVVLTGAGAVGLIASLNRSKQVQANLEANNGYNFENSARREVESAVGTKGDIIEIQTSEEATTESTDESESEASEETTSSEATTSSEITEATTSSETKATTVPAGGAVTVGAATASNGYVTPGTSSVGVLELSSGSSGVVNVTVTQGWNNNCGFSITKNSNGDYVMSNITSDKKWVVGGIHSIWDNTSTITLNSTDKSYLSSTFGLSFN